MADKFSKEVRSNIMSKIQRGSKPELKLRKALFKEGYRYSLKYRFKELNFTPDIVMVSRKTCIFVDGCFWHECPKCYKAPKSNNKFWESKVKRNKERDKEQNIFLREKNWKVIRIWEHKLNKNFEQVLRTTTQKINKKN